MTNSVNSAKDLDSILFDISPKIKELAGLCEANTGIDKELFVKHDVKRGLRDVNGKGVLAGLTNISDVCAKKIVNGEEVPCAGNLYYRGYNIKDLVRGFLDADHFGYEEIAYLLLFGELPTVVQLDGFHETLTERRTLPPNFVRDVIMKAPSHDIMNSMARSVLTLASYDPKAADLDTANVLRQSIQLAGIFPMLAVYSYHAYNHYEKDASMYIHRPDPSLSTAENFLRMLRPDMQYTPLEARVLDVALLLHAEHGGGNNSTFTTHVVSSSGTDTYSTVAASLGSLKGPKHGGANIKVVQMFEDMKRNIANWKNEDEVAVYLKKLLHKEAFDCAGLIYGMGHAVYSLSDPRANIFKGFVERLSEEKGRTDEYELYSTVAKLAPQIIAEERKIYKGVSANIDFYSGFVYSMLDLPMELYTPIFAISRIAGWSAHRIEELINAGKIIRPAYRNVAARRPYIALSDR